MVTSAPIERAIMAAPSPIGPAPMTAIFSPGSGFTRSRDGVVADPQHLHGGRLVVAHVVRQRIEG